MNIACFWWAANYVGGHGQTRYSKTYPDALKSQVEALGYELTVLTDTEHGRPLLDPSRYRGWFSKLEILRPENRDLRPCLVVDLDTFVFDLEPILALDPTRLWLIRGFMGAKRRGESGLFIVPEDTDKMWKAARTHPLDRRGDGDFLRQFPHSFIPDEVDGIYSYKVHCLERCPDDARVVCFHGKPRPHEAGGWAEDFFKEHAGT